MICTSGTRHRFASAVAGGAALVLLAAGCAEDEPTDRAATTTEAEAATSTTAASGTSTTLGPTETTSFFVSLSSEGTTLHSVGADEERTYGWNHLIGTTMLDEEVAEIELLGSVDYTDGSGTWSGFLTIETELGNLGLRAEGEAVLDATTKDTAFTGDLEVIGGTGTFAGTTGTATAEGTRDDELGGPVTFTIELSLVAAAG